MDVLVEQWEPDEKSYTDEVFNSLDIGVEVHDRVDLVKFTDGIDERSKHGLLLVHSVSGVDGFTDGDNFWPPVLQESAAL